MVMDVVLRAESISKSFGPIEVLSGVDLDLRPGEIHAIIGENGAGKSTLMKIVSGHLAPTNGHLYFSGQPVVFSTPSEAEKLGIVLVHQEILLAADLTVAQNIFLGREISRHGLVDDRAMRAQADAILAQLGSDIHSDTHVRELSIADRQIVQIARALLVPNHIVVFDEPTAVLTPIEAESLFQIIRRLRSQGVGILYISHRLSEVKAIADRVTVLRDGKLVATRDIEGFEPIEMARLMVGRRHVEALSREADERVRPNRAECRERVGAGTRDGRFVRTAPRRDLGVRWPYRRGAHGIVRGSRRP